jgi:ribonuclease P protein subunit RPR2
MDLAVPINSVYHPAVSNVSDLKGRKAEVKELARERIEILLASALREKDEGLAAMQADLAKKIAMRHRVRLPYKMRQLFCKKCKAFIVPGRTARVRIGRASTKAVRLTCVICGHTYRRVIAKKDL